MGARVAARGATSFNFYGLGASEEAIGRDQWGAHVTTPPFEECGELRQLILHHTAIRDPALQGGDPAAEAAYMRRIERLHLERGWLAVGYHFVIMPSGRVFAGRPMWALGAHVAAHNRGAVGIALAGNFERELPERAAIQSLAALRLRLAPQGRPLPLFGHGDLMPTACPGRLLRDGLSVGVSVSEVAA
jgi:N-acetylmuramoyl-L-alanine amidase